MDERLLFEKLVNAGVVTERDAKRLLEDGSFSGKRAEDLLYERRLADEYDVVKVKSALSGIPWKKVEVKEIPEDLLKSVPEELINNYKAVPLNRDGDMLVLGIVHPKDPRAEEALRFLAKQLKVTLGLYLVVPSVVEAVRRRYSPFSGDIKDALRSIKVKSGEDSASPTRRVRLDEAGKGGEEAPIIKIVAATLKEAVTLSASDIHIEPQKSRTRIRFRVDGNLIEAQSLPPELHGPIISRVKVLSNLKIDETRIPQDGRFRAELFARDIDFRVSTFPTPAGEKVALRVLDPEVGLRSLSDLGLSGANATLVDESLSRPYGMILITGPTGSGKSTTLYALMQKLNHEEVNIVSLEDPVEYYIEGVNQSQVRPEIGYDFASGLREILRQDPDVIMVGEIRDIETADLAVHSALTGHIVLSTLHTNSATGVIPRLIDMKIEPFLLPSTINLIISQRLVSRLCDACKHKVYAPKDAELLIERSLASLPES